MGFNSIKFQMDISERRKTLRNDNGKRHLNGNDGI
jgi:hypothetical protein